MDWVNVTIPEGFSGSKTWQITSDGSALNLATASVSAVIKPSQAYEDDDDATYPLSEGSGVTIVNASTGTVSLALPDAIAQAPSTWFYKIDVSLSGDSDTAIGGWINVTDT